MSQKRQLLKQFLSENLSKENISDFFNDWKEKWFKDDSLTFDSFFEEIIKNYSFKNLDKSILRVAMYPSPNQVYLFPDVQDTLNHLIKKGYKLGLVSDCGRESREIINHKGLANYFSEIFLSFEYGTTKDESLYDLVLQNSLNKNKSYMIGDDLNRDYLIPKSKGFTPWLLDRNGKYLVENKIQTLFHLKELL